MHIYHVYPVEDLRDHDIENEGQCWCHPVLYEENNGDVWVHNSMDQREKYETGELLPN